MKPSIHALALAAVFSPLAASAQLITTQSFCVEVRDSRKGVCQEETPGVCFGKPKKFDRELGALRIDLTLETPGRREQYKLALAELANCYNLSMKRSAPVCVDADGTEGTATFLSQAIFELSKSADGTLSRAAAGPLGPLFDKLRLERISCKSIGNRMRCSLESDPAAAESVTGRANLKPSSAEQERSGVSQEAGSHGAGVR